MQILVISDIAGELEVALHNAPCPVLIAPAAVNAAAELAQPVALVDERA